MSGDRYKRCPHEREQDRVQLWFEDQYSEQLKKKNEPKWMRRLWTYCAAVKGMGVQEVQNILADRVIRLEDGEVIIVDPTTHTQQEDTAHTSPSAESHPALGATDSESPKPGKTKMTNALLASGVAKESNTSFKTAEEAFLALQRNGDMMQASNAGRSQFEDQLGSENVEAFGIDAHTGPAGQIGGKKRKAERDEVREETPAKRNKSWSLGPAPGWFSGKRTD